MGGDDDCGGGAQKRGAAVLAGAHGERCAHAGRYARRSAARRGHSSTQHCCSRTRSRQHGWPDVRGFPNAGDLRAIGAGRYSPDAIPPPKRYGHQVEYYQELASALGVAKGPPFAPLSVPQASRDAAQALMKEAGLANHQPFVAFAPGAAYGRAKQWPPARFAELARLLADDGMSTVLIGTQADRAAATKLPAPAPPSTCVAAPTSPRLPRCCNYHGGDRERLRRDASCRCRRQAGDGDFRTHGRSEDGAASRQRGLARSARRHDRRLVPSVHVASVPDRPSLHDTHHRRARLWRDGREHGRIC